MNAALSWIKAYVPDLSCGSQEYCDAMTLSGTKVEGYRRLDHNLEKIVVGQIKKIEKHPDAEKLIVCQVDVGEEIQIVTGAQNVRVGDKVPVVLDGGKVAGGHDGGPLPEEGIRIKAGKLRGVASQGMMCSIEELGLDRHMYPEAPENGIYIFPADGDTDKLEVGDDAIEALGLRDTVFEYEVTSNRVDCYSVLGIARETAATFRQPFYPPEVKAEPVENSEDSMTSSPTRCMEVQAEPTKNKKNVRDYIDVEVQAPDLCPRYLARVCTDIKIAPSPKWMQRRLAASGIRPINNLVDITNYVMEEYGQPMHAYDLDTIAGKRIVVRRAGDGEEFVTLDGQRRKLDREVLMICDGEKEIGIAGIMGGDNSKITDEVRTVVFEAATFHGPNIRKSAKRIGLRTDASAKFEKGLDPHNAQAAIDRACGLIEELGCGKVVAGAVDVCVPLKEAVRIPFEAEKINRLLGTDISAEDMLAIFARAELAYDGQTKEIIVPSFRQDIEGFADIAEEVARFYGYDKIPTTLPAGGATAGKLSFKLRVEKKARDIAEHCGFSQGMTFSFESPRAFDKLRLPAEHQRRQGVAIANPLGEDFSLMRTLSLNGMLTSLATNYNRRNKEARLYELGNIYLPKALPVTELPEERMQFTLGMYGEGDFYTMKGVVEEFFTGIGMNRKIAYAVQPEGGHPFLHPGRQADISYEGVTVGFLGEVHPEVCDNYDIGVRTYVAVLDMPALLPFASFDRKYEGIAKYPAVLRDISMVVPKQIMAGQIEEMIGQRGGAILESCRLFDIYEGEQIGEGYKSLAYSISFRAKDRTLEEADVAGVMKKILNGLEGMGVELRK